MNDSIKTITPDPYVQITLPQIDGSTVIAKVAPVVAARVRDKLYREQSLREFKTPDEGKVEGMKEHLEIMAKERDEARAEAARSRIAFAPRDDVWHWQGDGHDGPETLGYGMPVVMAGETLREIIAGGCAVDGSSILDSAAVLHPNGDGTYRMTFFGSELTHYAALLAEAAVSMRKAFVRDARALFRELAGPDAASARARLAQPPVDILKSRRESYAEHFGMSEEEAIRKATIEPPTDPDMAVWLCIAGRPDLVGAKAEGQVQPSEKRTSVPLRVGDMVCTSPRPLQQPMSLRGMRRDGRGRISGIYGDRHLVWHDAGDMATYYKEELVPLGVNEVDCMKSELASIKSVLGTMSECHVLEGELLRIELEASAARLKARIGAFQPTEADEESKG